MGGAKCALHPEEIIPVRPILREKIIPLMQANAVDGQLRGDTGVKVLREAFRRLREVREAGNLVIEIFVIKFGPERVETSAPIRPTLRGVSSRKVRRAR